MAVWRWRYSTAGATSQDFPTQADAEAWIGESWRDLLDQGVDEVTLLHEDAEVYGPMGLRPAT